MPDEGVTEVAPARGGGDGEGLKKKVGPLPVWGWGLVLVGVVAVGLYLRSRRGSSAGSAVGSMSTAGGGSGVLSTDPLTGTQLLDALNNLNTTLSNSQASQSSTARNFLSGTVATLITTARFGEQQGATGPPIYDALGNATSRLMKWGSQIFVLGPANANGVVPILGPGGTIDYVNPIDIASFDPNVATVDVTGLHVPAINSGTQGGGGVIASTTQWMGGPGTPKLSTI